MKLFWNSVCPFVQRAWITAVEKQIPLQLVHIPLDEDAPEWYKRINPRETVPSLQLEDGTVVLESMYVAQYLDEAYEPKRALCGLDASTRLRVSQFIDSLGPAIGALYGLLSAEDKDIEECNEKVVAAVQGVEKLLAASGRGGPFFLGTTFSMADIAVVPFLDRFWHLLPAYTAKNPISGAPRLTQLLFAALQRPSVASTRLTGQAYIQAYRGYAKRAAFSMGGAGKPRVGTGGGPQGEALRLALSLLPDGARHAISVTEGPGPSLELPGGETHTSVQEIIEYLSDEYGGGCLTPDGPVDRARGRMLLDFAGELAEAAVSAESNAERIERGSAALEQYIQGPFACGEKPSVYDLMLVPYVFRAAKKGATLAPKVAALCSAARANAAFGAAAP